MNTDKELQLVAFQGEELFLKHLGSLESNKVIAGLLDADIFKITDPQKPETIILGERVSPEDIEWEVVTIH